MKINTPSRPWIKDDGHRHNKRTHEPFYQSSGWKSVRNAFMHAHPKCIQCGSKSEVCDHKVRIKDGGHPTDWNNLQAMCHKCHNRKDNNSGKSVNH